MPPLSRVSRLVPPLDGRLSELMNGALAYPAAPALKTSPIQGVSYLTCPPMARDSRTTSLSSLLSLSLWR